jgi:hypothetical protein
MATTAVAQELGTSIYKGRVGQSYIQVELTSNEGQLEGKVAYRATSDTVALEGKVNDQGKFELFEYEGKEEIGKFMGQVEGDNVYGTWYSADVSQKAEFSLILENDYPIQLPQPVLAEGAEAAGPTQEAPGDKTWLYAMSITGGVILILILIVLFRKKKKPVAIVQAQEEEKQVADKGPNREEREKEFADNLLNNNH